MALLKPEIKSAVDKVLKSAGVTKNGIVKSEPGSLSEKLESAGLSIDSLLYSLAGIVDNGDSDTVKLNAVKLALDAHKVLKGDDVDGKLQVNIVIQDSIGGRTVDVNPILLPREITP